MAGTKSEENGHAQHASAGDKHQTSHESTEPMETRSKRQKTLEEMTSKTKENGRPAQNGSSKEASEDKHKSKNEQQDAKSTDAPAQSKSKPSTNNKSAVEPGQEPNVPSNILEKGIIYFLIRGRVNTETPHKVDDIRRTYMLLRPVENDAKLGHGTIGDAHNARLLAVPKKVLPRSGRDRFMAFVEKVGASFEEIRDDFMAGSDYETKTAGSRHAPAARPVGEGVYALTTTGRESHLAYMLTLPEEPQAVQDGLGLKQKGSFILSTKNPKYAGPANANLPEGPEFPQEILEEFGKLRWTGTRPSHLDHVNAQVLLIGESSGLDKAMEKPKQEDDDGDGDKKEPLEVLEELEEEDLERMKDLPGDDSASIFADLQARADAYPKMQTTWEGKSED